MQCNQRRSTKGCHVTNTVTRNQRVWKYQTIELSPLSKVISKNLSKTKQKTTNCNGQKRLGRNYVVPSSFPSSTLKTDSLSFFPLPVGSFAEVPIEYPQDIQWSA